MPLPYHSSLSNHINIWRRTQIMTLLITPPPHPRFLPNYSVQRSAPKRNPITYTETRLCVLSIAAGSERDPAGYDGNNILAFLWEQPQYGSNCHPRHWNTEPGCCYGSSPGSLPQLLVRYVKFCGQKTKEGENGFRRWCWIILALVRSGLP
jgi:hypothetical protein